MSIFQQVILKRHINRESEKIKIAYRLFTPYFLNTDIQENIRTSKEEQFQRGFLRELFVNVLGYTLHLYITNEKYTTYYLKSIPLRKDFQRT